MVSFGVSCLYLGCVPVSPEKKWLASFVIPCLCPGFVLAVRRKMVSFFLPCPYPGRVVLNAKKNGEHPSFMPISGLCFMWENKTDYLMSRASVGRGSFSCLGVENTQRTV